MKILQILLILSKLACSIKAAMEAPLTQIFQMIMKGREARTPQPRF